MSAKTRNGRKAAKRLHRISRHGARAVRKTLLTLGDLVSAAYEVGGDSDAAALLLTPLSPLYRMLDRRIVLAS